LGKQKTNANIYNVLYVDFNKFYKILLPKIVVYCMSKGEGDVSDDPPDSCDSGLDTILYSASSQALKSMSLHRREQKGKNPASSDFFVNGTLTAL
jgi:hypothetical protein